ncbi:hypothetical protein EVAR_66904_1 [Eumeta japonica]|uniref:Histone-lysine N-methyltransferase SETMAR n=1 Tax=Eumeta variegata TaxID=151549 RepID=A0A4C1Z3G5_EUMVA|nr:hypothetical protein EVAR_66904_1 [Eumeta japonica]
MAIIEEEPFGVIENCARVFIRHRWKAYRGKSKEEFSWELCQAAKKISIFYGPNAMSVRLTQNFDAKDEPVRDKVDAILEGVEQDRHISSYEITKELEIDHKIVWTHLKKAGYTKNSTEREVEEFNSNQKPHTPRHLKYVKPSVLNGVATF